MPLMKLGVSKHEGVSQLISILLPTYLTAIMEGKGYRGLYTIFPFVLAILKFAGASE